VTEAYPGGEGTARAALTFILQWHCIARSGDLIKEGKGPLMMCRAAASFLFATLMTGLPGGPAQAQERNVLVEAFRPQIHRCYRLASHLRGIESTFVEVRLRPTGALAEPPRVLNKPADSPTARAALSALAKCTPFRIPAEVAGLYDKWKVMRISFDTQ
jgi:colicin import membrane protein